MRYELWIRGAVRDDLAEQARAAGIGCDPAQGGVDLWIDVERGAAAFDALLDMALAAGGDVYDPQGAVGVTAGDRDAVRARFLAMGDALAPGPPARTAGGGGRVVIWLAGGAVALWLLSKLLRWAAFG